MLFRQANGMPSEVLVYSRRTLPNIPCLSWDHVAASSFAALHPRPCFTDGARHSLFCLHSRVLIVHEPVKIPAITLSDVLVFHQYVSCRTTGGSFLANVFADRYLAAAFLQTAHRPPLLSLSQSPSSLFLSLFGIRS